MFLLLDAVFLCYRDIQGCKSQKSILICHRRRQRLYMFMHVLTWIGNYNTICSESCFAFALFFLLVWPSAISWCCGYFFFFFFFEAFLLEVLIFSHCLMNRDIWWGIFAALFVAPAEYSNFVCILSRYLLVSRFSLAYCRAICFSHWQKFQLRIFWVDYSCVNFVFLFNLRLLISNNFLFVSVIPDGLQDRLAGLLSRTWWRG